MEDEKFYSLVADSSFKYLFKNHKTRFIYERIIDNLLNIDISDYHLIDGELNNEIKRKTFRLDSLLESNKDKNKKINIEMNNEYLKITELRNDTYLYNIAGKNYEIGSDYNNYQVIQINFNNYQNRRDKDAAVVMYEMYDKENKHAKENIRIYEIYMENLKDRCYNEVNKYIRLLCATSIKEIEEICNNDKELGNFMEEYEKMTSDDAYLYLYDAEKVQNKVINTEKRFSKEEGIHEEKVESAKRMLEKEMNINLISEITELTIEEIEKIKEEINK